MNLEALLDGQTVQMRSTAEVIDIHPETGIVECRIAPYETEADLGDGVFEVFTRGCFAAATKNPTRVRMSNQGHDRQTLIGKAIALRSDDDAVYGTIKVSDTSHGRDVLTLLRDEVLTDVSVEFLPQRRYMKVQRTADRILVRHDRATLLGVSPVGIGAHQNARVLSVRDAHRDRVRERLLAELQALNAGPKRA